MSTGACKRKSMSPEHKRKISEALKGRTPKFIPDNKGKKRTEENKKKISESLKKLYKLGKKPPVPPIECLVRGEKHPWWKGGITTEIEKARKSIEYKVWRKAVKERDNYTCIWCGSKDRLIADHIKPFAKFPELRFDINNGRTLCHDCHKKTDTYGKNLQHYGNEIESAIEMPLTLPLDWRQAS
jgi:5-methylcytosine-specific restriction endonuclease McrA